MNKCFTFACGQGGTKACIAAINEGTILKDDFCVLLLKMYRWNTEITLY